MDDFNKQCAEALGWELVIEQYYHEGIKEWLYLSDMHFHDSFDWAMLLVAKCCKDEDGDVDFWYHICNSGVLEDIPFGSWYLATPQQISQACLEVLK